MIDGTGNALPTGTALSDSGTLDLNGYSQQVASVTGSGTVTNGSSTADTFTVNNAGVNTFAGLISGKLALIKSNAGTLTLSDADTYTGSTTLLGGTLSVSADNNLGTAPSSATAGSIVLNGGTLQATASFTLSSKRGIVLGPTSGSDTGTIDVTSGQTLTYGGILANNGSGTGAFTKIDSGTLTLSGLNTYTGPTTISAGTVADGISNALPSGTVLSDSGTLDLNGYSQQVASVTGSGTVTNSSSTAGTFTVNNGSSDTFAGLVSGNLALTKSNSGTLTLASANTYGGATIISAGTLADGFSNALPSGTALSDSGTLDLNGFSQQVAGVTGSGTVTNSSSTAGTFTVNNGSSDTFAGLVSGNLALTKSNSGTLTLGSTNTYSGATTISAGTLQLGATNAIPSTSDVTDNATLDLDGHSDTIGALSGSGSVTSSVAGAMTLTVGADNHSGTFSGVIHNGSGTVALSKSGSGTETLSGVNTYSGTTTISAGTIADGISNALPTGTALSDNGTLDLNGFSQQVASVTGSGTVTNSSSTAGTFTVNNASADTFAGLLGGNLSLTKSNGGTLTLGSANTYTGPTTISAGTLADGISNALPAGTALSDSGTLDLNGFSQRAAGVTGSGTVTNSSSTAGSFTVNNASADTFAGLISGNLALTKSNSGTLTLSGANMYSDGTTVNAGTLLVTNSSGSGTGIGTVNVNNSATLGGTGTTAGVAINSGGTLSPGVSGPGTLAVSNLVFSSGAIALMDVNSPYATAGTDYDQVIDSGALTLNGATLTLNGGATAAGALVSMELFNHTGSGAVSGTFNGIAEGTVVSVGSFQGFLTYKGGSGNNSVVLESLPSTRIDDGTAQRSMVRSLTLTFASSIAATLSSVMANLSLKRASDGLSVGLTGTLNSTGTVLTLKFTGSSIIGGSLADGRYTLSYGGATLLSSTQLWRLFGDLYGTASVNAADYTAFMAAMSSRVGMSNYSVYFDYNADGIIVNADETAFMQRYGTSI